SHQNAIYETVQACRFALESFEEKGCDVLSLIVNRTPAEIRPNLLKQLKSTLKGKVELIYSIPLEKSLESVTMAEIAENLDSKILYGEKQLNRLVSRFVVAAMHLRNYLPRLTEGSLIITPIDRLDIILGTLAAFRSQNMPEIAGIILTGYLHPDKILFNLLEGMPNIIPILKVQDDTFTAATKIDHIRTSLSPDDTRKIATALGLFESHVDTTELRQRIVRFSVSFITPKMFEFGLIKRARKHKQHIGLPEGEEERILRAVEMLTLRDAADFTILGDKQQIQKNISDLGLNLDGINIVDPTHSEHFDDYVDTYYRLRQHKGITPDNAWDVMSGVTHFGTMMVYKGHADGMVSGAVHSTLQTVRPSLEFIKTRPGSSIMSSVIFMCLGDRILVYGDCAVNPKPTAEELAEIAITSAETARIFGVDPKIAMLSYSSGTSGIGKEVDKVREATRIAHKLAPDLQLEGPIQYDAAIDPQVARTKMPDSQVAGKATIFIFPDLNTGNNTYKAVQRSTKALAIGPIMQGLNKPVNDLSRGCTVPDIANTIAITAIQAQADKGLI
ncbi:MAG: phosphate acetyltransferase, partial [Proteobacteria bacterium]|nr:phosphate acetyltransferase [Pseudomonadota bacterium]